MKINKANKLYLSKNVCHVRKAMSRKQKSEKYYEIRIRGVKNDQKIRGINGTASGVEFKAERSGQQLQKQK